MSDNDITPHHPSPERLVAGLVDLLTVTREGPDRFTGAAQPGGVGRVFGGQVIAQALQAAQATVEDDRVAHSLHAYFLRGGEEGPPIDYATLRDFDGRSFANRRVVASQGNTPILNLTASFQRPEEGLHHQHPAMPAVPSPDDLPTDREQRIEMLDAMRDQVSDAHRAFVLRPRPIETRSADEPHWATTEPREPRSASWFRTVAPLPPLKGNEALHRAVIAYASDYTLLGTSAIAHGLSWMRGETVGASLDHAVWFHADAAADEWLLYATDSPWTGGGRGFNRGSIFTADGVLVASVAQEGVMRRARPRKDG